MNVHLFKSHGSFSASGFFLRWLRLIFHCVSRIFWNLLCFSFKLGWLFSSCHWAIWLSVAWSRGQLVLDHKSNSMRLQRYYLTKILGEGFSMRKSLQGGVLQNRWTWTKGQWQGGTPRPLQWTKANLISTYDYSPHLSFVLLSNWTALRYSTFYLFSSSILIFVLK